MTSKLRRMIAFSAARLLYFREESEYYRAKFKAAKSISKGWVKPKDLPSNREIREEVQALTKIYLGDQAHKLLLEMRAAALHMMTILKKHSPSIIGSVLTGHVRQGSDIDLHLFSDSVESIRSDLTFHGYSNELVEKRIKKGGERKVYRHLIFDAKFPFELTVYSTKEKQTKFISSITSKPIEKANVTEFEQFLRTEYTETELTTVLNEFQNQSDPLDVIYNLLLPLENVSQNPKFHPEGDVLYHSLQVFDLACDQRPYDEEFLLAALLHDLGKGIDKFDHVQAGVDWLQDLVSERTLWLIGNHMAAHKIADRTIGSRHHKRLRENPNYEDLSLLQQCDRNGRKQGVETSSLEEAIDYIKELRRLNF